MEQKGVSDPRLVDSVVHATLASMAAVDGPLALDARLADVEIDSLDLVELTQILEDECEVNVPASAFADVVSVVDVVHVVWSHLP